MFKLWDPIKKKTVISRNVILYENLMLKQSITPYVSTFEGETSSKHVIHVDVDPPPVNNMQVVSC